MFTVIAICRKVAAELDRWYEKEILSPVTHSDWATPVVPVLKSDGSSLTLYGDFSHFERCMRGRSGPIG